jgi:hypothetical protein
VGNKETMSDHIPNMKPDVRKAETRIGRSTDSRTLFKGKGAGENQTNIVVISIGMVYKI